MSYTGRFASIHRFQVVIFLAILFLIVSSILFFAFAPFLPWGKHESLDSRIDELELVVQLHLDEKRTLPDTINTHGMSAAINAGALYVGGKRLSLTDLHDVIIPTKKRDLNGQVLAWHNGVFQLSQVNASANRIPMLDDDGRIPLSQIPPMTITNVSVVPTMNDRDSLRKVVGDVVKVIDGDGLGHMRVFIWNSTNWLAISNDLVKNTFAAPANTAPTTTHDSYSGYAIGSKYSTEAGKIYEAVSVVIGEARWKRLDGVLPPVSEHSTDRAIVRFDGTDGTRIKDSTVIISDEGNIILPGTLDGRDVSQDGSTLDAHVGDANLHRIIDDAGPISSTTLWSSSMINSVAATKSPLLHTHNAQDIVGGNIADDCISSSSVLQHAHAISHQTLTGAGSFTHAQIDFHINDADAHRQIQDNIVSSVGLWSSQQTSNLLAGKAALLHQHTSSEVSDFVASVNAQIDSKKAQPNGLATLDSNGKVPASQLALNSVQYQGTWNAATNAPNLSSDACTKGYYYVISVAGSTNLDGVASWNVGDWAICSNTNTWEKADHSDAVTSVAGKAGAVTLVASDITSGTFSDSLLSASSITQHQGAISHAQILHVGTLSHDQLDNHVQDASLHRVISNAVSDTTLWSSSRIVLELLQYAPISHTHTVAQVTDFATVTDARILLQKAAPNGLATLDSSGKVPSSQFSLDSVSYQGTWNAATNMPALTSSNCTKGHYYVISVAGSTALDGQSGWQQGDWTICSSGNAWEKADFSDSVTSVAGKQGAITLYASDISLGSTFADGLISASSILQHQTSIVHGNLIGAGSLSHAQLDAHVQDATKHRVIDDIGLASPTTLWSSQKMSTELATKASNFHSHVSSSITDFASSVDARITTQKAQANGLATLDGSGKIPASQLALSTMEYRGAWNANTNVPSLTSSSCTHGHYYVVSVAGTTLLDGVDEWAQGDWVICSATTVWEKADYGNSVSSVAGKQGNVILVAGDITGTDTFANSLISSASILQHQSAIAHQSISGSGSLTHAQLDAHVLDDSKHLQIDDVSGASISKLWSSMKISTELSARALSTHTHAASSITSGTFDNARISAASVVQHQSVLQISGTQISPNPMISGYIQLADVAEPAIGSAGTGRIYKKTGAAGLFWKPDASATEYDLTQSTNTLVSQNIGSNIDATTSSITYTLLSGMTVTPVAGTYMVWFTCSATQTPSKMVRGYFAFHLANTVIAHTERTVFDMTGHSHSYVANVAMQTIVTVNGAQAVQIMFKTGDSGTSLTAGARTLTLLKV